MLIDMNIPLQNIPNISNETITFDKSATSIRRFFVLKYTGELYEVNRPSYDLASESPFFDTLIINWYIRGTVNFVRDQNRGEIDRASKRITNISKLLVNLLQFYQNDN